MLLHIRFNRNNYNIIDLDQYYICKTHFNLFLTCIMILCRDCIVDMILKMIKKVCYFVFHHDRIVCISFLCYSCITWIDHTFYIISSKNIYLLIVLYESYNMQMTSKFLLLNIWGGWTYSMTYIRTGTCIRTGTYFSFIYPLNVVIGTIFVTSIIFQNNNMNKDLRINPYLLYKQSTFNLYRDKAKVLSKLGN